MTPERIEKFLVAIKPEEQYNNYLKGKRVAIVGPSKHILLEKNGSKIDDYDVVIRLKWLPMKGFNTFKDFVGDETHVIYSSAKNRQSDFEVLEHSGVKHTRHPECSVGTEIESETHYTIASTSYTAEEYAFIMEEYAKEHGYFQQAACQNINSKKSRYNIWPQLGFNAIMDTISSDAKEIYITGFTMYHGGGHMLQKNKPAHHNKAIVEKHNGVLEILMLNDVIGCVGKRKKIALDSVLQKILNAYNGLGGDKEVYTPVMSNLTNEINNLVKDL